MLRHLLLTLFLLATQLVFAKHIIGGEITYECLGGNVYRFTMHVYRDCGCDNCAELDQEANIAIYKGAVQFGQTLQVAMENGEPSPVDPPLFPCLDPPDVCVEEGLYIFEATLPASAQSYHIIYQRCCRNETITNLIAPDDTGITLTVEVTPAAQSLCNNSPVFEGFPPTIVCAGFPLSFDHSAVDADGDQLVYSFCAPLKGGGLAGTPGNPGNGSDCDGTSPNPPCPPPFDPVDFVVPQYNAVFPLGTTAPAVSINAQTGLITGIPTVVGQFVVGVCVDEYRNGVYLSTVRRDFQFNVALCEVLVTAAIAADSVSAGVGFYVNSCADPVVTFNNESTLVANIFTWRWTFPVVGEDSLQSTDWDATITFPDTGFYFGTLLLNEGTPCADTAYVGVTIFPKLTADFSFEYDTCVAGPVFFRDSSTLVGYENAVVDWDWAYGDASTNGSIQEPLHQYLAPDDWPVTLTVTDFNGCVDDTTIVVGWYPAPAVVVVYPSVFNGCVPDSVYFNNQSFPLDSTYQCFWNFGDGDSSGVFKPTHFYDSIGVYTVSLTIVSPIGCVVTDTFPDWIGIHAPPDAGFSYSPSHFTNFENTANFYDGSTDDVTHWVWKFGENGHSLLESPTYTFQDTGLNYVQLIVRNKWGCFDSTETVLDIVPNIKYYLPNAFSPNGDDENEFFGGVGYFVGLNNFKLSIWNRWGELQFETTDPTEGWNGRKTSNGRECDPGMYIYKLSYHEPRGALHTDEGRIFLVK